MNKKRIVALIAVVVTVIILLMCTNSEDIISPSEKESEKEEVTKVTEVTELTEKDETEEINVDTLFLPEDEIETRIPESEIEYHNDALYNSQADDTEHLESEIIFGEDTE